MKKITITLVFSLFVTLLSLSATNKVAFISTYESLSALNAGGDDDEVAAANWFVNNYKGTFVSVSQIKSGTVSLSDYNALWIAVDRVGTGAVPAELLDADVVTKLTTYYKNGGNLLLSTHATQLIVTLGRTTRVPGIRGAGAGGVGTDTWTVNPVIGKLYDHSDDIIFANTTSSTDFFPSVPNATIPLIGPGNREDHNSMWDLNSYSYTVPAGSNTVKVFEDENNAKVLATWGQVVDFCCAGIVYFAPTTDFKGKCYAIGVAAYEWNQNSGVNLYQSNIENLTKSTLDILATPISGIQNVSLENKLQANIINNKLLVEGSINNISADLFSVNGNKLKSFNTADLNTGTDVSSLNKGLYILKIYNEKGTALSVNKLIK
jgi:hypothetical protein